MPFHVEGRAYTKDWRPGHGEKLRDLCMENIPEGGKNRCKNERYAFKIRVQQQWRASPESGSLSGGPALWPVHGLPRWLARWVVRTIGGLHVKNLPGLCMLWSHSVGFVNPSRALINSTTENNYLPFVLYFSGHLILWKITSWVLGLDYSFDKSSRPLSFLFPLSICLWTISQVSPLCSTKERRKIKPNWSNYFIAGVLIHIRRVKPLTKSTKGEKNTSWAMALYQVLWYLEIYFISK